MKGRRTQHRRTAAPLRVLSANVQNTGPNNDAILELGNQGQYDVIHVQEPYAVWGLGRQMIKSHPAYKTFMPLTAWTSHETRPRALTYVRKSIPTDQLPVAYTRYAIWVHLRGTTLVNVYRKPRDLDTLDKLTGWTPPAKCVVTGDFNAGHETWQSGTHRNQGEEIANWTGEHGLQLLNSPDYPTHDAGGVLDLAFSNIPHAIGGVAHDLECGSDHRSLGILVPTGLARTCPVRKHVLGSEEEDEDRFLEVLDRLTQDLPTIANDKTSLDLLAASLSKALSTALHEAGKVPNPKGNWAVWWNEECKLKHRELLVARRTREDPSEQSKEFKRAIKRAKRELWRARIDGVKTEQDVYAISKWANRTTAKAHPPPLVSGGTVFVTPAEKGEELRKVKLQRVGSGDDHPLGGVPTVPTRSIEFDCEVSLEEAYEAACTAGNTAPGADEVNVRLLRLAWPLLGHAIRLLYERSLQLGHYPAPFRDAEVVMITKPGKTDLTSPKSYRPISLTSCLGKGIDRILAWRMSYLAIEEGVLDPHQIGSLPRRSANDIAASLTHDVETALENGKVCTLVTMDVEGAFDCVLANRLSTRLREQGWPDNIVRLVHAFMTGRRCRVRMDEHTGDFVALECGLPQGSPSSPILFSLYTEPICKLRDMGRRYGYADDTGLLTVGATLEETSLKANSGVRELERWGEGNAVRFDYGKTEVMHFSHKLDVGNNPVVVHAGHVIQPQREMRWLGIWFDRKLTFKYHVDKWTARANRVAGHLRSISNTHHGPPPWLTRKAIKACVEPVLYHGAEVWYPGQVMPARKDRSKMVRTGVTGAIEKMERVVKTALRAILPVWRTTPIPVLHREGGLLPAADMLEHIRRRSAVRMQALDPRHPVARRAEAAPYPGHDRQRHRRPTRLQRTWGLLPISDRPTLRARGEPPGRTKGTGDKDQDAVLFEEWRKNLPYTDILTYTDGSLLDTGAAGWGYVIRQGDYVRGIGSGALRRVEVFDAEARGALEGLKAALAARTDPAHHVHVLLDNQSVVNCLRGRPADSSQEVFLTFQELAATQGASVRWIPGHKGIQGNDDADALAGRAAAGGRPTNNTPSLAWVKREARRITTENYEVWGDENLPTLYRQLGLRTTLGCPKELHEDRATLHHLLAARTQHGDFADYHERFGHDATLDCSCGKRKHPTHPFYCRKVARQKRLRLEPSAVDFITDALGPKNFRKFVSYIRGTSFFTEICPRIAT